MKLDQRINEFRYWLACRISPWVADVDWRFSVVLCDVTSGMSKTNYTIEAMRAQIADKREQDAEMAIDDFLDDHEDDEILERAARVRAENEACRQRWAKADIPQP